MSGSSHRVFVPCDSAAVSVGANETAEAIAEEAKRRELAVEIVRTGSRGLFWLEPMIEVEVEGERVVYGPVGAVDVPGLFDADWLHRASSPPHLGAVESIDYLARQERLTFNRCGVVDPLDLDDYRANGGLDGLRQALGMEADAIVSAVTSSGLRGRGGAGFPAGRKWRTVLEAQGEQKYIGCNAEEGDSGTFADRMLLEGDPMVVLEGMVIAGLAVGAEVGLIYVRSEYPDAIRTLKKAVAVWEGAGILGDDVLGSPHRFAIEVRRGAGAYICGEESSMLESLEGKRGMVRARPPLPAEAGLLGQPTVVNNVLTLAAVPWLLAHGADQYAALGTGRSLGTQPFQLAGNVKYGGLVEVGFGVTLKSLIEDFGGGTASGRPVKAVQVGGPLGTYLPASMLDIAMDYESLAAVGAMLGHGGIVVFDDTVDMARQAGFAMAFCAAESCGKCTPCRVGAVRGVEVIDHIRAGRNVADNLVLLDDLCEVMRDGSLCAMGGLTPQPVESALAHFPEDFRA
jgi:formate dehydrogenase iron-sulfur subunit